MKELQPLLALLAQTVRERDAALAAHAQAQAHLMSAQQQSQELTDYRKEYEQRWAQHFKQSSRIELVNCYQAFMQRLTLAMTHQEQAVARADQQVASARSALQACEMRVASVEKLIERRMNEQRLHAQQQEQKMTDEFAARLTWQRPRYSPNSTY